MTVDDKGFVDKIIEGNGRLPEHPEDAPDNARVVKIVKYTNAWGGTCYGLIFQHEPFPTRYEVETKYVRQPEIIWEYVNE